MMLGAGMGFAKQHDCALGGEIARELLGIDDGAGCAVDPVAIGGTGGVGLSTRWACAQADDQKGSQDFKTMRKAATTSTLANVLEAHFAVMLVVSAAVHEATCASFLA